MQQQQVQQQQQQQQQQQHRGKRGITFGLQANNKQHTTTRRRTMDPDDLLQLQQHKQQLSTPLLGEPARIKCVKFPLSYLVTLPRTTLLQALSPSDLDKEAKQLQFVPSPIYPDILEVQHVHASQGEDEDVDERHHQQQHPSLPPGMVHIQGQDRLTHVNGQPVHSIEQLQCRLSQRKEEETVTVRLLRKNNPFAEYIDMDDLSSSSSSFTSSSSGDSSSYYYSSSQDEEDQDTSLLSMLMTGGGCISFSPSSSPSLSSSSSSLTSTSASSSSSSSRLSTAQNMPLQPYESWGDEASLEHTFYKPLWCFPLFLYLIQAGDTLPSLARSFGLKIDVLRRDNRDKFKVGEPAGVLIPGQKLRVRNIEYDGKATAAMAAHGGGGGGRGREGGRVGGGVVVRVSSSQKEEEEEDEGACSWREGQKQQQQQQQQQQRRRQHVVVGGETMKGLCARYGVSELDIRRSNRHYFAVGERSVLRTGMCLTIFPSAVPAAAAPAPAPLAAAGSYMSPSAVGVLWKRKGGGSSSPLSSSPRTSSSGSSSSSSSSGSRSGGGKGGGREEGMCELFFFRWWIWGGLLRERDREGENEEKRGVH